VFETDTTNSIIKKEDGYLFENDTMKIVYRFWKFKGLMAFEIYNKLDVPLYIDWKRSSFIYNSYKMNYWIDEETGSASSEYYAHAYNANSENVNGDKGEAVVVGVQRSRSKTVRSERRTFIPPNSQYAHAKFNLLPDPNFLLDQNTPFEEIPRNDKPKRKTKVYTQIFNAEDSPVIFRNYVTFSLNEQMEDEFTIDHGFYLSKATEMDYRHFKYKVKDENGNSVYKKPYAKWTSFYLNPLPENTVDYRSTPGFGD
jgi:hypothetical protein